MKSDVLGSDDSLMQGYCLRTALFVVITQLFTDVSGQTYRSRLKFDSCLLKMVQVGFPNT
jgi:hypothetical protein